MIIIWQSLLKNNIDKKLSYRQMTYFANFHPALKNVKPLNPKNRRPEVVLGS